MQLDHIPDDDQRRRLEALTGDLCRHVRQRCHMHTLTRGGALLDQRDRRGRSQTIGDQLLADQPQAAEPHVEDQRLGRTRQRLPIQVTAAILQVAGDEAHRLGVVAMSQRNTRVSRATGSRRDARHDLEADAGTGQGLELLPAAPEDEGVTALQAHHAMPGAGVIHQRLIDAFLGHAVIAARLADVQATCVRIGQRQNLVTDQAIMNDDIGLLQMAQRLERQQLRIARPRADQRHLALRAREAVLLLHGQHRLACHQARRQAHAGVPGVARREHHHVLLARMTQDAAIAPFAAGGDQP